MASLGLYNAFVVSGIIFSLLLEVHLLNGLGLELLGFDGFGWRLLDRLCWYFIRGLGRL